MINARKLARELGELGRASAGIAAAILAEPAGGTVDARGRTVPLSSGYVVGGRCQGVTFPTIALEDDGRWIGLSVLEVLARADGAGWIGWWTDAATGVVYVDAVDVVDRLEDALRVARSRGELAVWDAAAGVELRLESVSA